MAPEGAAAGRLPRSWRGLLWLLPAALFLSGALQAMGAHALYMDAVNPDYLVARLLGPAREAIQAWVLPGNLRSGRFPLLVQPYHGALPFWFGLPLYALLGTGTTATRIVHACFALGVLAALAVFLRAFGVRGWLALLACCALALDGGFLLAFRTQFYITLLPLALVLLAAALTERGRLPLLAGLLAGLAVHGYFIHAVFLPVLLAHAWWRRGAAPWAWLLGAWIAGGTYLVGFAFAAAAFRQFAVGHALVWSWLLGIALLWWLGRSARPGRVLGLAILLALALAAPAAALLPLDAPLALLNQGLGIMQPGSSTLDIGGRLLLLWRLSLQSLSGAGAEGMLLGSSGAGWPDALRALLLTLPVAAALLLRRAGPGLWLALGLLLAHLPLALLFGDRLWTHHLSALPVLAVAACALALSRLPAAALLVLLPLALLNAAERQAKLDRLAREGGAGLSDVALTRFARTVLAEHPDVSLHAPDWGVLMPFVMETGGRIPVTSRAEPEQMRCGSRPPALALLATAGVERLARWEAVLGPATVQDFPGRDGAPYLRLALWPAQRC